MTRVIRSGFKCPAFLERILGSARGTRSFLLGGAVVALLTIPYSFYLSALSSNEAKDFLYTATGVNYRLDVPSMPSFLVPVVIFVTFQAVAMLTYSILRIGTSTILAVVGTIIFNTSAQVALVFMSAPLWDMASTLPLLGGLLAALLIVLIPAWFVLPEARIFYRLSSRIFVGAMIVIALLLSAQNWRSIKWMLTGTPLGPNGAQIFISQIVAFGLLGLSIVVLTNRHRISRTLAFRRETSALVTIAAVMSAIFLTTPWLTGARSYQGPTSMLLLVLVTAPLFSPIKGQLKLRIGMSVVLLTVVDVTTNVVSSLFMGGTRFGFYLSGGWQPSSQLVSGLDNSSVLLGIPYTDGHSAAFVEQQGLSSLAFLWVLGPMFMLVNLNYAFIGVHYLLGGTWLYSEPPVGAVGIFWDARMLVVDSAGIVSTVFGVFAILLLLKYHRRAGLFILSFIFVIILLLAFSRPMMHQWWYIPIFGAWTTLYCLRAVFSWVRGTLSSSTFSVRLRNQRYSIGMGKLAIPFRALFVVSITLVSIVSIAAFSDFASQRATTMVSKMQNRAQSESLAGYSGLPWTTVEQSKSFHDGDRLSPSDSLFDIPKDASLIRISAADNCSLSGSKFALQNEGQSDETKTDVTYTSRYFVGSTPSKVAYLPVTQKKGQEKMSHLFLQRTSGVCQPSVAAVSVDKGEESIVGWLPNSCRFEQATATACAPEPGQAGTTRILFPPFDYEGYLVPEVPAPTRDFPGKLIDDGSIFASMREAPSISAKVLGAAGTYGFRAKDVWVSEWRSTTEQYSVRVSGKVVRGSSIIGVEFDRPNEISSPIPPVNYRVKGSIFNRGVSQVRECFSIPAGSRYRVFVGGITNLYSPSWNNIHIQEIGIGGTCDRPSKGEQWLPTLD